MKPKTLLVLTVLVAAIAAFIWFVERDLPSSEERADLANRVLPVEPDEVAAVAIDWGGETVRLERRSAAEADDGEEAEDAPAPEWHLAEPYDARADRAAVDTLLDALTGLRKSRTLEDVEPAEVGLAEPRGSVTLTTADGELRLLVGAAVPGSDNVIVGFGGADGGGDAWVAPASFLAQLEREPSEWRSREVLSMAREDVEEVRLWPGAEGAGEGGAEPVVLGRRGERFRLEAPLEDLASADAVERLLADLATLRARRFLDDDPRPDAELGLDPPRAVVEATVAGGGTVRVELGAPVAEEPAGGPGEDGEDGAVYARVGDQRFEAVTGLAEAAARPPGAWRSPSWTVLRSFEVDRIEVAGEGGEPLTLTRAGVDWRRRSGSSDETIPYTAASDLLFALTEAKGAVADLELPEESRTPLLTVRLASDEGEEETLTLFPAVPGPGDGEGSRDVHLARSSARSSDLLLPASAVTDLLDAVEAVRTAEPDVPEDGETPPGP